ncbi:MAG: hypothetical protein IPJ34_21185 [Myxococcales bacterium]|nr:hypothetical protein [Myxococcales bacterium]
MKARSLCLFGLLCFAGSVGGCGGDAEQQPDAALDTAEAGPDPEEFSVAPRSCGYDCPLDADCVDVASGYQCPSLGAWGSIPHADTCAAYDPTKFVAAKGACTATTPTGEAVKKVAVEGATRILPDGRRVTPAGKEFVFATKDLTGGLPSFVLPIPGQRRAITVDTGYGAHVARAIDVDKLLAGTDPVTGLVRFDKPKTLGSSAAFVAPDTVYLPTSDGVVQALTLGAAGALDKADARSLKLPTAKDKDGKVIPWHLSAVAASPNGKRLVATPILERTVLVYDVDPTSATYGTKLSEIDLGEKETFAAAFDPRDPSGRYCYVTMWGGKRVVELDLDTGKATRSFPTDKNPQGITFLDARWMAVANAFGDTLTLVDRVAGSATPVPVDVKDGLHGLDPSSVAFDAKNNRLYASLAGVNALSAWDVDLSASPPKLTPVGRLATGWWPGGVGLLDDGGLVVANMRAGFDGPNPIKFEIHDGDVMGRTYGSVQAIPFPSAADLVAGEAAVKKGLDVAGLAGAPTVECGGAAYDFPIPKDNKSGPSKQITRVVFILRENKTFDALFGDLPGVDGDPKLVLGKDANAQAKIWANLRGLAQDFAHSDNYYTSAELSQQGHFWAIYGRSSDHNERTWAVDGYERDIRRTPFPSGGVLDIGVTVEGGLFDWLMRNKVGVDIFGEAMGVPREKQPGALPLDAKYPGGFIQSMGYPDTEKSCHVAGRWRVRCDLRPFVFMTLSNDHTVGVGPKTPPPDAMIAVNDEATGMIVDAITHSPEWEHTLIMITEDDPAVGGEHVDVHRTPFVMISPWVKRKYVSKTHIDVSSIHKIIAHVYGVPYPNVQVEKAALPFDLFTGTPDYTPWTKKPREWPLSCGGTGTSAEKFLSSSWDLTDVDENPELDRQVERWMKGKQLEKLSPQLEAEVRWRLARKAAGLPVVVDDDD